MRTFKPSNQRARTIVDVLFAASFFLARIYLVVYILSAYGSQKGQSAMTVFRKLRIWCQLGTGSLWISNILWWLALVRRLGSSLISTARSKKNA